MAQEHEETYEDRKKNWDLSGSLENIIRRYIHQITNAELKEINSKLRRHHRNFKTNDGGPRKNFSIVKISEIKSGKRTFIKCYRVHCL